VKRFQFTPKVANNPLVIEAYLGDPELAKAFLGEA